MNKNSSMFSLLAIDDDGYPLVVRPTEKSGILQFYVVSNRDEYQNTLNDAVGHLIIRNPFILSPSDPFVDLELFSEKFGHEKACEIALSCQSNIEKTKNWNMLSKQYFVDSVESLLRLDKRNVDLLYIDFDSVINNKCVQFLLKESGFDGLIYQSSGDKHSQVACIVFEEYQYIPISEADGIISPESMLCLKISEIKKQIIQSARSGGVSIESSFIQSVHRQMLPVDIFDAISEKDPLVGEVGKHFSWARLDYAEFGNRVLRELNEWLNDGGLKNNIYVRNNIKDRDREYSALTITDDLSTNYEIR